MRYKLVQRKDFTRGAEPDAKKYYAQIVSNGTVSFDEFCEDVAEETALTSADVKSCIDRMTRQLAKHLREGRTVQLGELGTMRASVASTGSDTVDGFDASKMMKKPTFSFMPGKRLQEAREKVLYERISDSGTTSTGGSTEEEEERPGGL